MSSDTDSFDDSFDENDIDQAFQQAELTQKTKIQTHLLLQQEIRNSQRFESSTQHLTNADNDKVYEILGENAILKNQLARLQQDQLKLQEQLKNEYLKIVQEKEESIQALNEHLLEAKSKNEFLVSENKSLNQTFNKKRKLRHVEMVEGETPNQTLSSTQNTSYNNTSTRSDLFKGDHISDGEINAISHTDVDTIAEATKVIVINQATFFYNEKTLFIETLSNYVIPGMSLPALQYLERISSSFEYSIDNFEIFKDETSFKSAILKYLINFQDRDRIDNLLTKFIKVLSNYIEHAVIESESLLAVPFLVAIINFALDYKHLAISESLIGELTKQVCSLLFKFPDILKQEYDYITLPSKNQILIDSHNDVDLSFIEKPIHIKILEMFSTIFLCDVLLTLSKIASVHLFNKEDSACNSILWKNIPEKLLTNSLLSRRTPVHFIYNTICILMNSIIDEDRFAFENIRINPLQKVKELPAKSYKPLEQLMSILTTLSPSQIHFDIYGLNNMIGSNDFIQLLELVVVPNGELSSQAKTNSFDAYERIIKDTSNRFSRRDEYILRTKLQILELFEIFYSTSIMLSLPHNMHLKLLCILNELVGEQQELIYRAPRSANNATKVEIITKSVIIIHHLLEGESIIKVTDLPKLTYRELISNLMKITSNSMKNQSIEFITKLRNEQKFNGTVFIAKQEIKELDSFGLWNSVLSIDRLSLEEKEKLIQHRIQVETDIYNGIEFNYPDEMIAIARDIFSKLVTEDESERIYKSINYIEDDDSENLADFEMN